nr:YceI family protein [Bdellovibrionales bacterium]
TWSVDPSHTSIVFKVDHMNYSNVYGMLEAKDGTINLNTAKPETSTFEINVKADSVNTMAKKRDDHLRNPDFFNVKQFPIIAMKSKSIKKKSANEFDVVADLTLHGVTKPVSFVLKQNKTGKDPWGNTRTGAETAFKIKRSDFNMTYMSKPGEVGDEIELIVNVEATQK